MVFSSLETRRRTRKPKGQTEERVSGRLEDLARVEGILVVFWKEVYKYCCGHNT